MANHQSFGRAIEQEVRDSEILGIVPQEGVSSGEDLCCNLRCSSHALTVHRRCAGGGGVSDQYGKSCRRAEALGCSYGWHMSEKPGVQFSWGWILASLVLGLSFIGLAHLADLFWQWPEVTVGTLTDIGAALLIAFFLFILERRFTRRVTEQVRSTAEAVVEEKTQGIGTRLDDLEARLNARRAETQAAQDQALDSISDAVSFDSLTGVLAEAEHVGAIGGAGLTVPAGAPGTRLMANFRFGTEQISRGDGLVIDDGTVPRFRVTIIAEAKPGEFGLPHFDVRWEPEIAADEVGARLEAIMRQRDHLTDAKALDFPLSLGGLQRGLRLAIDDQRVPRGEEKLRSKLRELIGQDWAITNAGVQNLGRGWAWTWDELGILQYRNPTNRSKRPSAPEGVDEADWIFIYQRADDQRPRGFPFA